MNGDSSPLIRVGYWWSDKKSRKFNMKLFLQICRNSGLELVKIDLEKPLEEQGPFAAIVHKLSDPLVKALQGDPQSQAVCRAFQEYEANHPEVVIIDSLQNIEKLLDRFQQYKLVENSEVQKKGIAFIPAFVELTADTVPQNLARMKAAGVTFPCVCKPSVSHGSSLAHQMCLIFNKEGLNDIKVPCVAQKFVNHNAVLYKLFIIEDKYFVFERPSLKNFTAGDQKTIFFDSHDISKAHSASELNELDEAEPKMPVIRPDKDRLDYIVNVLRQSVGLSLFGIDVIIDNSTGQYFIIDMNIFPSYDEVENFFQLLCDLIKIRIAARTNGVVNFTYEPVFINSSQSLLQKNSCKKFIFNSTKNVHEEVIPYSCKCFCCPITGVCDNALPELHGLANHRHLDLTAEMAGMLQNLRNGGNAKHMQFIENGEHCCTPDSAQDDSGIETSDSCDEKKKTSIKSVKRQHSKSYSIPIMLEENV